MISFTAAQIKQETETVHTNKPLFVMTVRTNKADHALILKTLVNSIFILKLCRVKPLKPPMPNATHIELKCVVN